MSFKGRFQSFQWELKRRSMVEKVAWATYKVSEIKYRSNEAEPRSNYFFKEVKRRSNNF